MTPYSLTLWAVVFALLAVLAWGADRLVCWIMGLIFGRRTRREW